MLNKGMYIGERYEIIERVGSGGMSDVYKAKDHKLGRFVAIKVLKQEFSEDKSFVSKFKIEAQSAAGLAHPNIVNIFDVGEDNGLYYIVMELIEGITLKTYISRKGTLPVKEAVSIAVQVAQGIEAAHNNHIIHRDIKPQNIMISKEGKVKVTDFGIARAASTNTINSNAMGSVHYISPEQARNGYVDEKSDIYSLGITLFEMITGSVPFEGDSTVTIALQHVQDELPSMSTLVENVPVSVDKIVEKCTQKKPDRRYLKVSSLIADLKKSLVAPDEDFVQLIPVGSSAPMVMISEDEVNIIKRDTGIDNIMNDDRDDVEEPRKNVNIRLDENEEYEYDEFDGGHQTFDKLIAIGSILGAVLVIGAAIFFFSRFFGNCSHGVTIGINPTRATTTNNGETTDNQETTVDQRQAVVPSLVGRNVDDALALLEEKGLVGMVVEYQNSTEIQEGRVISQQIAAGEVVDKGTTINFVVSDGAADVEVPDVAGQTKEAATKLLEGLGFEVSTEFQMHDEIEVGYVIGINKEVGKKIAYASKIIIYVSQGKDTKVEIPNIKGMSKEEAEIMLGERGLVLNVLEEVYSDEVEEGCVINQDIAEGTVIDTAVTSNIVSVTISLGKEPPTTTTEAPLEATAAFRKIGTGDYTAPALTEDELATAVIRATISYIDASGARHDNEDVTEKLNGYNSDSQSVAYTTGWTHERWSITLNMDPDADDTDVVLEITLYYTDADGVLQTIDLYTYTAVAQ